MSKTDKTQPYWVMLAQNPQQRREIHDHRHGVCNLEEYDAKRDRYISYWSKNCHYREYLTFNVRPNVKNYRPFHIAKERTQIRNKLTELRKMMLEDIYDDNFGNYQHRHSALWEAW